MDMKNLNPDGTVKATTQINVSGVPVNTLKSVDAKVKKLGITRTGYIKNLINQDLKDGK
jgi:hypothetical protein